MTVNNHLLERVEKFIQTTLATWSEVGVDRETFDFIEALDFDAKPLRKLARRGRVQARQILTLAMANKMGDDQDNTYLSLAESVIEKGLNHYLEDGALIAKLDHNKEKDGHLFAYEQAFLLSAYAWLYAATGKKVYAQKAEAIWQWLETHLANQQYGGFNICLPDDENNQIRQQNPHMHLFEACLICVEHIGENDWLERAHGLFSLFEAHFYYQGSNRQKVLLEFFTDNWQKDERKGDIIEPGHHFEWVWLLSEYQRLGSVDTKSYQQALFQTGINYGLNALEFGVDELDLKTMEVARPSARLWVECELLKAYVAMNELDKANELVDKLFNHYLIEDKGIWYDQLNEVQQNIAKNAPASTLYHLYIALNEYRKVVLRSNII